MSNETSSQNASRYYLYSKRLDRRLIFGVPLILLISVGLAIPYACILVYSPSIYINLIFTVLFGALLGYMICQMLPRFHTWGIQVGILMATTSGLLAVYVSWVVFEFALAGRQGHEVHLSALLIDPSALWERVSTVSAVEALVLVGLPVVYVYIRASIYSAFCEKCQKWVPINDRMIGVPVTEDVFYKLRDADIVKSLSTKDWSVLKTADPVKDWSFQPSLFIALGRCESCDGPFVMCVEVHGKDSTGKIYVGGILAPMEIDKESGLKLIEIAAERKLLSSNAMYKKAIEIGEALGSKKDLAGAYRERQAMGYGHRGTVYQSRGKLHKAEAMFNKALTLFEALEHKEGMAQGYRSLGIIYLSRGELDKAEAMFNKALALFEALRSEEKVANGYGLLGTVYQKRAELDKAEAMYNKALAIDKALGNEEGMAIGYRSLGDVHQSRGELEQAKEAYKEALKLFQGIGSEPGVRQVQAVLDDLR